jgi:hypothetical protein
VDPANACEPQLKVPIAAGLVICKVNPARPVAEHFGTHAFEPFWQKVATDECALIEPVEQAFDRWTAGLIQDESGF